MGRGIDLTTRRSFETDPDKLAALALGCVHREYPNQIAHAMRSDDDVAPPRKLTPAFYGCFDWHSAVHGHWTLARIARLYPEAASAAKARAALERSLTPANIAGEVSHLRRDDRRGFERPYGLAWLLTLARELHEWKDTDASRWGQALEPLSELAAERLAAWLPSLSHPIRSGEHSQSAFSMGLAIDWARAVGERGHAALFTSRAIALHGRDREAPLHREPSGHDFLSPSLAEADLMRRALSPTEFSVWLDGFLPDIAQLDTMQPAVCANRADGKLAHLDGLNFSRAWMLEGIAHGLPAGDARSARVLAAAERHARAGLAAIAGDQYELTHWLGSFATYFVTQRGID